MPLLKTSHWKTLIVGLALVLGALDLYGALNWARFVVAERAGTLGMTPGGREPGLVFRVAALEPASPLAAVGVKAGDAVRFDRLGDARRVPAPGEVVRLEWHDGQAWRPMEVRAVAREHIPAAERAQWVLHVAASVLALGLALVAGLRRADQPSARFFALALLTLPFDLATSTLPSGALQDFLARLRPFAGFVSPYLFFAWFSLNFPEGATTRLQERLRRLLPLYGALAVALAAYLVAQDFGLVEAAARGPVPEIFAVASVLLSLLGLASAWRGNVGAARARVAWVALSMGLVYLSYMSANLASLLGLLPQLAAHVYLQSAVIFMALTGLAYGLFRHRVFDFGFAVNRALVYGVASAVLLVSFGLLEWTAHKLIHFDEQHKNTMLDAGIAIAVFLAFHKVRHHAEHWIERLFFRAWHVKEEALRRFVRRAAHVTTPAALVEAFARALDAFGDGAACRILRRHPDGSFRTPQDEPSEALGPDHPVAVALRAEPVPMLLDPELQPPTDMELAVPMAHRGELNGIVLIGRKPRGDSWRPDELELLGFAVHQVGLDLHALEVAELRAQLDQALTEAQALRSVLVREPVATAAE